MQSLAGVGVNVAAGKDLHAAPVPNVTKTVKPEISH